MTGVTLLALAIVIIPSAIVLFGGGYYSSEHRNRKKKVKYIANHIGRGYKELYKEMKGVHRYDLNDMYNKCIKETEANTIKAIENIKEVNRY